MRTLGSSIEPLVAAWERAALDLPPAAVPVVLARLAAVQSLLAGRLLAGPSSSDEEGSRTPRGPEEGDRWLTVAEAAALLGVPPRWMGRGSPSRAFGAPGVTACKRAALAGRIPHDFRRTAVRNLERAGVPRSTAMEMVRHRTESIYRRYAIAD